MSQMTNSENETRLLDVHYSLDATFAKFQEFFLNMKKIPLHKLLHSCVKISQNA